MRFAVVLLCLTFASPLVSEEFGASQQQLVGLWEHPWEDHFTIGELSGSWDKADRYSLEWRMAHNTDEQFAPWGGVIFAWDEREGDFSRGGEIEVDSFILGLTGGGGLHLLKENRVARLDPTLSIFGRFGIGFQDGRIKNYPLGGLPGFNPGDVGSADLPSIHYEFGLGLEASILIARKLIVTAGIGTTWWLSNESTSVVVSGGGGAVAISADYAGGEAWSRLGLGMNF